MIKITFRELLEAANLSKTKPGGDERAKTLLGNPVIHSAVERQLKQDWASKNQIALLYVNVNDTLLVNSIRGYFKDFIDGLSYGKPIDNPLFQKRAAFGAPDPDDPHKLKVPTDPLYKLFYDIREDPRIYRKTQDTISPPGASFLFNASKYTIDLSAEEVAALGEVGLAALSEVGAGIGENMVVPKSAVFMTDKKYAERYRNNPFPVFTGIDMRIITMTPHVITQNITLKTLTYSMHAGVIPVSTLGRDRPKGWSKSDRVVAGTMIATVTVNDPLMDLQPVLYASDNDYASATSDIWRTYLLPDQFPEFDVLIMFNNEYGFNAALPIYGIKFTDTGTVMSMSDSEIEVTYTYTALDIDIIRNITGKTNEDGITESFDPLENNEYLAKRERAYKGISEHKSLAEVPALYGRLDSRAREIEYNKLRNAGLTIGEMVQIRGILENK